MRPVVGVGLMAIVLMAGCAAVTPNTPPVTPAPVPPDVSTDEDTARFLARGVDPALVVSRRHARHLQGTAFTVRVAETVAIRGGPTTREAMVGRFGASRARYFQEFERVVIRDGSTSAVSWSYYADGERLLETITRDGTTTYYLPRDTIWTPPRHDFFGHPIRGGELYVLVRAMALGRAEPARTNRTTAYRVQTTTIARPDLLAVWEYVDSVERAELSMTVTSAGFVSSYRVTYVARRGDDTLTVTRRVRYDAVGSTAVPVPDWYLSAMNATDVTRPPQPSA